MLRAFRGSAADTPVVLPLTMVASRLSNHPMTRHECPWPASVTWNTPRLGAHTPQIEFKFRSDSTKQVFSYLVESDFSSEL